MGRLLNVAFVWHMHQPYYGNDSYIFPWVRMHAIKDYYDMVSILQEHPNLHQTFNLTPCLLNQIESYAQGSIQDKYWEISMKPAENLAPSEKLFILRRFCNPHWHQRIHIYPRYLELCKKVEFLLSISSLTAVEKLNIQEFLDLQVWFNLSWFDPYWIRSDKKLEFLISRGQNFSEDHKLVIADKQREIMKGIIPLYKEAQEKGQIEVTASPYYHPILPLLYDSELAKISSPQITLPQRKFAFPEDVKTQIMMSVDCYKKYFGRYPRGLWPSELAVGEEILPILGEYEISWIISDEGILARSLGVDIVRHGIGHVNEPKLLYRPYLIQREGASFAILFRDRLLSDLISFTYHSWAPGDAAQDLIRRLNHIQTTLGEKSSEYIVTVALDGENCWEFYENDGYPFLHAFYSLLEKSQSLRTITISEYLAENPPKAELSNLHTGSWIDANLRTWIGDVEHAKAWDFLFQARETLSQFDQTCHDYEFEKVKEKAWNEIYMAEGSDWFWWFSKFHRSELAEVWDRQFRIHLRKVYKLLGAPVPDNFFRPILGKGVLSPLAIPIGQIQPIIDGKITDESEWLLAGYYDFAVSLGTQSLTHGILKRFYYGWDFHNLYLRIDTFWDSHELEASDIWIEFYFSHPRKDLNSSCSRLGLHLETGELGFGLAYQLGIKFKEGQIEALLSRAKGDDRWEGKKDLEGTAVDKCIELKIPFKILELKPGDETIFALILVKEGLELEKAPREGVFSVIVPK